MARKPIIFHEMQRKAILSALREAKKLGYVAKYRFKNDLNIARDALNAMAADLQIYCTKAVQQSEQPGKGTIFFYWRGDGALLTQLFKDQGLAVAWNGSTFNSIEVLVDFDA